MDVVYIDASSYPRRARGELDSSLSWIATYYVVVALCLVPAAIYAPEVFSHGPLWAKALVTAGFLGPFVLTPVLVLRGQRIIKPSRLRVEAYGATMRSIARALGRLRWNLDRQSGWSNTRKFVTAWLLRLVGAAAAAAGFVLMVTRSPLDWQLRTLVIGCFVLTLALWLAASHLLKPRRYGSAYFRSSLLRFQGAGYFMLAAIASAFIIAGSGALSEKLTGDRNLPWYVLLPMLLAVFLVWSSAYERFRTLWGRADAKAQPASADARRFDRRRPILFLRSFPDDRRGVGYEMTHTWEEANVVSLEDALHAQVKRYGPFVAIGEPGRAVSAAAARDHFAGDDWQPAVLARMDEAFLIALVAGWSEGVQWELDQAVRRGHAKKLLIILPDGPHLDARWKHVCRSFSGTPWHAALIGADVRAALAVHCDGDNRVVVIASRAKSAGHYEAAVELAIYGMFCRNAAAPEAARS